MNAANQMDYGSSLDPLDDSSAPLREASLTLTKPSTVAAAQIKVATSTNAITMSTSALLEELVKSGRISISSADLALLRDSFAQETQERINIPGCVVIGDLCPTRGTLEAISAVFNTVELRELIFTNVPASDLLVNVQRVCKGFKAAIQESSQIGQIVFRVPINFEMGNAPSRSRAWAPFKLYCVRSRLYETWCGNIDVTIGEFREALRKYPSLGSTFVTQPPLRRFELNMNTKPHLVLGGLDTSDWLVRGTRKIDLAPQEDGLTFNSLLSYASDIEAELFPDQAENRDLAVWWISTFDRNGSNDEAMSTGW